MPELIHNRFGVGSTVQTADFDKNANHESAAAQWISCLRRPFRLSARSAIAWNRMFSASYLCRHSGARRWRSWSHSDWPWSFVARQEPAPTFRSAVDLIQLDISVLDKARRPVHGLSAADFTVRVDGVVRPVVAFKAVDLPPAPPPPVAPWMRDVAPDVATNSHPGGRAIVIVIDDHTVPPTSSLSATWWMVKQRAIAHRVVDELGPDDLAAVVFVENNHTAQGFTGDRKRLLAAIDNAAIFPPIAPELNTGAAGARTSGANDSGICYCGDCSPRTLASIADSLRSLPQQRKIVVYIGSGVAVLPDITEHCNALRLKAQLDALHKAALANVTFQAIDPQGLVVGSDADNPATRQAYPADDGRVHGRPRGRQQQRRGAGGAELCWPRAARTTCSASSRPQRSRMGRFHAVRITVNRPGLEVRTRSGYYDPTTKERKAMAAAVATRDLDNAIGGVMPKADFPNGRRRGALQRRSSGHAGDRARHDASGQWRGSRHPSS